MFENLLDITILVHGSRVVSLNSRRRILVLLKLLIPHYPTMPQPDEEIYDDDELQGTNPAWNQHEWISCGRQYHDVPRYVVLELNRMLLIPESIHRSIPSATLSISEFLKLRLPKHTQKISSPLELSFSDDEPDKIDEIEEDLANIVIPSFDTVICMEREIGQAWFDGKQSIKDDRHGIPRRYPFWMCSYFSRMQRTCTIFDRWADASSWLKRKPESVLVAAEEEQLTQTITDLWDRTPWIGTFEDRGIGEVYFEDLVDLLRDQCLRSDIVDGLLERLSLRLKHGNKPSSDIIATTASFSGFIKSGAYATNVSAQRFLDEYATYFRGDSSLWQRLAFVVHHPPVHWAACVIDFHDEVISYGDSLRWKPPKEFHRHLLLWLKDAFPTCNFTMSKDSIPCGYQKDSISCAIAAVNCVAHNILNDALWTPQTCRPERMKAFIALVKGRRQYAQVRLF